jgi:hypothetical protein
MAISSRIQANGAGVFKIYRMDNIGLLIDMIRISYYMINLEDKSLVNIATNLQLRL